jgi:hypothetical protein
MPVPEESKKAQAAREAFDIIDEISTLLVRRVSQVSSVLLRTNHCCGIEHTFDAEAVGKLRVTDSEWCQS